MHAVEMPAAATTSEMKLTAADISELELPAPVGDLRRIELLEKLCRDDTGNKITLQQGSGFSFVHESDARARPPDELVLGLDHHPDTVKKAKYYFVVQAKHRGENRLTNGCRWRTETGRTEVRRGEDVVGHVRRLSYAIMTGSRHKSQHWVMMEYTLANDDDDGDQSSFVLSVVHNSGYNKRKGGAAAASSNSATVEAADHQYGRQKRDGVVVAAEEEEAREGETTAIGFTVTSITKEPQADKSITTGDKHPGYATTPAANLNKLRGKEAHQIILTNMAFKLNTTILEIVSEGMLGERDLKEKVSPIINGLGIPPDCTEGRISLKLFPSTLLSHEMIQQELGNIVPELKKFAHVTVRQQRSIISLIGSTGKSTLILDELSNVLLGIDVKCQNLEQRGSKVTTITFEVNDSDAMRCLQALNSAFFERKVDSSSAPVASSGSGSKRKVDEDDDHPEAPPVGRQQKTPQTPSNGLLQQTDKGAGLEINNSTIPVNSPTTIRSEPIPYTSPKFPPDMIDKEIQMPNGVEADQNLNNEPELLAEVMGCDEPRRPTYLGSDKNMELDADSAWWDEFFTGARE